MYDSGALIDLKPSSIRLEVPYIVKLMGKGGKERIVHLQNEQVVLLKACMGENRLLEPHYGWHQLFFNCWRRKLTRLAVNHVLKTYADMARKADPALVPERISCHALRQYVEYHKGIKQNASAGRSPANLLKARANHIFRSISAYVKLEKLRLALGTNHFAMKAKVYLAAVKAAYKELNRVKEIEVDYEPA